MTEVFLISPHGVLSYPALDRLNDTYASILTEGRVEQHPGPLEGEGEDAEHPDLPCLSLAFNRRDAGRLRLMVNDINVA